MPICDDIKIEFLHKKATGGKEKMFHMWFNTFFIEDKKLVIPKPEIDKARLEKLLSGAGVTVCAGVQGQEAQDLPS